MHGNVWDWCQDFHDDCFYEKPEVTELNPVSTPGFENRTARGGDWVDRASDCRSAYRRAGIKSDARGRDHAVGFRVASSCLISCDAGIIKSVFYLVFTGYSECPRQSRWYQEAP